MPRLIQYPEAVVAKIKSFRTITDPSSQDCFDFIKSLTGLTPVQFKEIVKRVIPLKYLENETFLMDVLVKENNQIVACAKGKAKNSNFYLKAVTAQGFCLIHIPEKYRSLEVCEQAIRTSPTAMASVPKSIADYDFCFKFIKIQPTIISDVPREHLTYELCLAAVNTGRIFLYFVPTIHRTVELCLLALEKQKGFILEL